MKKLIVNSVLGALTFGLLLFIMVYCTGCSLVKKSQIRVDYVHDTVTVTVTVASKDSATTYQKRTERDSAVGIPGGQTSLYLDELDLQPVTDAKGNKTSRTFRSENGRMKAAVTIGADGSARFDCVADSLTMVIKGMIRDSTYQGRVRDSLQAVARSDKSVIQQMSEVKYDRVEPWYKKLLTGFIGAVIGILLWEIFKKLKNLMS